MATKSKTQRHLLNLKELTKTLKLTSNDLFSIENFCHSIPNNWISETSGKYFILHDEHLQRCTTWPVIMLGVFENKNRCMISVTLKEEKINENKILEDSKKWWHQNIRDFHCNTNIENEKARIKSNDLIIIRNITLKSAIKWLSDSTKAIHDGGWSDVEIPSNVCSRHTCKFNNKTQSSKKTKPIWQPKKSYHYGYEKGFR
jgi:hypothetical protein